MRLAAGTNRCGSRPTSVYRLPCGRMAPRRYARSASSTAVNSAKLPAPPHTRPLRMPPVGSSNTTESRASGTRQANTIPSVSRSMATVASTLASFRPSRRATSHERAIVPNPSGISAARR